MKLIDLLEAAKETRDIIVRDDWESGIIYSGRFNCYLWCEKSGEAIEDKSDWTGYKRVILSPKLLLEDIYNKILEQNNYKYMAYMMNNYNKIIEHIKSEIDVDLPELKKCNLDSCIFKIDNNCCNVNQEYVTANNLECDRFIRSDYYEVLSDLKRKARHRINEMNIDELERFLS